MFATAKITSRHLGLCIEALGAGVLGLVSEVLGAGLRGARASSPRVREDEIMKLSRFEKLRHKLSVVGLFSSPQPLQLDFKND